MSCNRAAIAMLCATVLLAFLAGVSHAQLPAPHYRVAACTAKGRFLAFPPSFTAMTSVDTFGKAEAACSQSYADVPDAELFSCLTNFIAAKKGLAEFAGFANAYTGPWIYLASHKEPYRYLDRDGNTRGAAGKTTSKPGNRVICAGKIPFQDLGGGDTVFRDTTACRGMFLTFPNGQAPNTNVPALSLARDQCKAAGMRLPTMATLACMKAFVKDIQSNPQFKDFVSDQVGPWIHLPGQSKPYCWMDTSGNTKCYTDDKARHDNNHVICFKNEEFPDLGGGDLEFRDTVNCPGTFLRFPNMAAPNKDTPTLLAAQSACQRSNLTLPTESSLGCMQAFLQDVESDTRFADFAGDYHGPWIHMRNETDAQYRWMDKKGNTQGYQGNTIQHGNNHVICVGKIATGSSGGGGGGGESSTGSNTPLVAGATCGAIAVLALVVVGYMYRETLSMQLEKASDFVGSMMNKDSEDGGDDEQAYTGRRGGRNSATSQTDLMDTRESFHDNVNRTAIRPPPKPAGAAPAKPPSRYY